MRWKIIGGVLVVLLLVGAGAVYWLIKFVTPPVEPTHIVDPTSERVIAQGKIVGFADDYDTQAWLGIPYAAPPTGMLRWRAPRPALGWSGTKQALSYGAICPQFERPLTSIGKKPPGSITGAEDCLYLNIWAPHASAGDVPAGSQRLPVMVWLHGGGNSTGTGADYGDIHALVGKEKVVGVTINYRLGILGWFHHPALNDAGASAEDRSGNYGTLDIIEALRWVKANIAAFGGDPDRVTIFGQSAGATNIVSLLTSPVAKGSFQRAISESAVPMAAPVFVGENFKDETPAGQPLSSKELLLALLQNDQNDLTRAAAKARLAAMTGAQIESYLHGKPAAALFAAVKRIAPVPFGTYNSPKLFRDGVVLPDLSVGDALDSGKTFNAVPVIIGANHDEVRIYMSGNPQYVRRLFGIIPRIRDKAVYLKDSQTFSEIWRRAGAEIPARKITALGRSPVFVYRFDWSQQQDGWLIDQKTLLGACHAMEMPFVMGELEPKSLLGKIYGLTKENEPGRKVVTEAMDAYWAEFAYSGDPGKGRAGTQPQWKAWPADPNVAEKFMVFDDPKAGGVRMAGDALSADGPANFCPVFEVMAGKAPGTFCKH